MNFIDDFRNESFVKSLLTEIHKVSSRPIRIMEVCGGHTMAIRRYGIHNLLPSEIELLSGPGCPVCVTDQRYIDLAIAYAKREDVIFLTYGDLLRVPGTYSSLEDEKARGADVRIIYSTIQALEVARENPDKKIVFAAIGFETTTPGTAIAVLKAEEEKLENFFIISAHKIMPPPMNALIEEGIPIDGYIGPGHVTAIAGSKIFSALVEKHKIPIVISGFEPVDLLQSVLFLAQMIRDGKSGVNIQYSRLVNEEGNLKAQQMMSKIFEPEDQYWRGIGSIPLSGLRLNKNYSKYDAEKQIPVKVETGPEPKACLCGQILKGLKKPTDCPLFGKKCTPTNPVGACMVSTEGGCHAYYNFREVN